MDAASFIADLRARNFAVYAAGDALYVTPTSKLLPEDMARIRETKPAILAVLNAPKPMPSLRDGWLRIGFDCDESFQWWKPNSQTLAQTLADLDAPADVVKRYLGKSDASLHAALGVQDCKGNDGGVVAVDGIEFCTVCGWFYETPVEDKSNEDEDPQDSAITRKQASSSASQERLSLGERPADIGEH